MNTLETQNSTTANAQWRQTQRKFQRKERRAYVFYEKGTHKGHCMVENRTGSLDLADLIPNVTDTILIESFHKHSGSF